MALVVTERIMNALFMSLLFINVCKLCANRLQKQLMSGRSGWTSCGKPCCSMAQTDLDRSPMGTTALYDTSCQWLCLYEIYNALNVFCVLLRLGSWCQITTLKFGQVSVKNQILRPAALQWTADVAPLIKSHSSRSLVCPTFGI